MLSYAYYNLNIFLQDSPLSFLVLGAFELVSFPRSNRIVTEYVCFFTYFTVFPGMLALPPFFSCRFFSLFVIEHTWLL